MANPEDLIETLTLERIELNLFRGVAPPDQGPRIFGGHVIAQALLAAYETVAGHVCHSLHCYFLRPGDPGIPILYEVDRARDGGTFVARRVTAIQNGKQIFNLAGSFQTPESGFEHQDPMPRQPSPETLPDWAELRRTLGASLPAAVREAMARPRPIELRHVDPLALVGDPTPATPIQHTWMRAARPLPDDIHLNQAVIAYASDMVFMSTSMRPHGLNSQTRGLQHASLDHAVWFHRPSNFGDWHLYAQKSPSASGGRGFNLGEIYSRDGRLVASTAQEGLIRFRPLSPAPDRTGGPPG
ncbi:MAG: acyl-CoA thioesterase II [Caulobacteraceae bacterium]|nr:acyl-CoA thioesterase II [Caulobacteraceae bacterium]